MNAYHEITTQEDMDRLLELAGGFHDSMTKEIHIVNRGYVSPERRMAGEYQFDVQLLIQSPMEPYGLELVFGDIVELQINSAYEYFTASGRVEKISQFSEAVKITVNFDGAVKVAAKRMFYRVREDWLGKKVFLKSEVPAPDAVAATALEGKWRQCCKCAEAWEAEPDEIYLVCPRCGELTELQIGNADGE